VKPAASSFLGGGVNGESRDIGDGDQVRTLGNRDRNSAADRELPTTRRVGPDHLALGHGVAEHACSAAPSPTALRAAFASANDLPRTSGTATTGGPLETMTSTALNLGKVGPPIHETDLTRPHSRARLRRLVAQRQAGAQQSLPSPDRRSPR